MATPSTQPAAVSNEAAVSRTVLRVLMAISFSHLLNDTIQSLMPAIYPVVKESFHLNFSQIGLITLTFQLTASVLQPSVGILTDRWPQPYSLAAGMTITLVGLLVLAAAGSYPVLLGAVGLVGVGSAIFHPEASRVARMASGGRHGFAQSVFQVGGNAGSSLGPLLAAVVVAPGGHGRVGWFSGVALLGIGVLARVGKWYQAQIDRMKSQPSRTHAVTGHGLPKATVLRSLAVLILLMFSKFFYLACFGSYYTFYLISRFNLSVASSQIYLFLFLFSVAAGTLLGGPVGDRFGRKWVIWISILGVAPFSLALPYLGLAGTALVSVFIGILLASAFPAILVYAQELLPGRIGLVAGLFFGFAFGLGGIGSALLGRLADQTSIAHVFKLCGYLPLLGLLTALLPNLRSRQS